MIFPCKIFGILSYKDINAIIIRKKSEFRLPKKHRRKIGL